MSNLILHCPKCGKELTKGTSTLYECNNLSCNYTLNEENTIDISFKSKGISKALSNLCPYPFTFDNVYCSSMESFIQSLKVNDSFVQKDVCSKTGPFCYSIRTLFDDWRITQKVFWQGKEIDRHSNSYITLLKNAYISLYNHSPIFCYAIKKVKKEGYKLQHSIGCTDSKETLLTPNEYINLLYYLMK